MATGTLEVLVLSASGLKDVEFWGRQDPYLKLEMNGQRFQTHSKTDAGKNAIWNERVQFINVIPAYSTELSISAWDRNATTSDTEIGAARVPLANVYAAGTSEQRVQLVTRKGKSAGEVALYFTFKPFGGQQQAVLATAPPMHYAAPMQPAAQYAAAQYGTAPQYHAAAQPVVMMPAAPQRAPAPMYYAPPAPAPAPMPTYSQQPAAPMYAPQGPAPMYSQVPMPPAVGYAAPAPQYAAPPAAYPPAGYPYPPAGAYYPPSM